MAEHQRRRYPYWKVQTWDAVSQAWRDVQRAHPRREDAVEACPRFGGRLMRVERDGRYPEPRS